MDWRQHFADYKAALLSHQRAQSCADELGARLTACTSEPEQAAIRHGIAVAMRRMALTSRRLAMATETFTQGRSVVEAIWSAPDDI